MTMNMENRVGKSYWFDLPAADVDDAKSFYEGLFNWKFLRLSDSILPDYWVIQAGEELIGGLRKGAPEKTAKNTPVLYFTVKNLAGASSRVRELGGKLEGAPVHLGKNRGSFQWVRDREGNLIALWAEENGGAL